MMKGLLKRMLGNARINYDRGLAYHRFKTLLMNGLITITEDHNDLITLTPAMFMRGLKSASFPEGNLIQTSLTEEYQKRQTIQRELKERFRKEYLAQLVQRSNEKKRRQSNVGDVVLIESDDKRRVLWPLGVIDELIPGEMASPEWPR